MTPKSADQSRRRLCAPGVQWPPAADTLPAPYLLRLPDAALLLRADRFFFRPPFAVCRVVIRPKLLRPGRTALGVPLLREGVSIGVNASPARVTTPLSLARPDRRRLTTSLDAVLPAIPRGHPLNATQCPLLGVKQTWVGALQMSAFDPKRTLLLSRAQPLPAR